jgi:hypothetical protein
MGQQHRKVAKRRRRKNYLERKKEVASSGAGKPAGRVVRAIKKIASAI